MDAVTRQEQERLRIQIRWAIRRDMPEILQIEEQSFEYAWTEDDFLRCLRQRNCIHMVAELSCEKVLGFMLYELHKSKFHILNFAVHPNYRRISVGTQMVAKLTSKLSSHGRTHITLEVRETNLVAQLFFRKQHFTAIRTLRNYYKDSEEDAYFFKYQIDDTVIKVATNRVSEYFGDEV